jgi:catechol 2,3-dioxygenase-like lactoylglutathione lyase family enzyme
MMKANGLHHLAISTADIKTQIEFFSDVLGMELVALYWMHGVEGAFHGFLRLNGKESVAFVQSPANKEIEPQIGVSHAGSPATPSAPGTMQHVAFNVDGDAELLAMRDRIRSRGLQVLGPIDHGFCKSIYFAGPENLSLELSTSPGPIDARAWIDPEVVALCGISGAELSRYKKPVPFADEGGTIPQPPYDASKPQQVALPKNFADLLLLPDEQVLKIASVTDPPVKVETGWPAAETGAAAG